MGEQALKILRTEELSTISVDVTLSSAQDFFNTAAARGIPPGKFLEVMIKSFTAKTTIFGLNDKMSFGKYAGLRIEDLIRADPSWCRWAIRNTERFDLNEEAYDLLEEIDPAKAKRK